jgi:integrase
MFDENVINDFKKYLKNRKIPKKLSYLTIKNYIAQINNFFDNYSSLNDLPVYLAENPNPCRRFAISLFLDFLQKSKKYVNYISNYNINKILDEIKKVKEQPLKRKRTTITIDEGRKFISELIENKKYELAVILMICYDTGARVRAILKLRKKDFVRIGDDIYVYLHEKRGKVARRLIAKDTFKWICNACEFDRLGDDDFLFLDEVNQKIKNKIDVDINKELDKLYYKFWKEVKLYYKGSGYGFHSFRRGAGVFIYNATKKDIVATSDFLGHEDARQTKKYLEIQADRAEEIIRKRENLW